jgi:phosphohistidine phosphatase SixA
MKKWILIALALFSSYVTANERKEFTDVVLADPAIIDRVKQGGLVIYMRHGATNTKIPDQVPIDLNDCSTQRPLTEEGLAEARQIGVWVNKIGLPYSQVLASPLCRAVETAKVTFGRTEVELYLQYTAALTTSEKKPIIAKTRELLSTPVAAGTNRVLVAHGPNMVEMMSYFPPEATLIFFEPLGSGQFKYIASIPPKHWPVLLKQIGL